MIANPQTIEDIKANREEWAAALESGRYQQGVGTLRDEGDRYCCLGVLCDLYPEGSWNGSHYFLNGRETNGTLDPLPSILLAVDISMYDAQSELIKANDHKDIGFAGIAAMIRELPLLAEERAMIFAFFLGFAVCALLYPLANLDREKAHRREIARYKRMAGEFRTERDFAMTTSVLLIDEQRSRTPVPSYVQFGPYIPQHAINPN